MARDETNIEVVRGRLDGHLADEVLGFWASRGALAGEEAHRRLREVVCTLRRGDALAGVSSAHAADLALVGGRRFWIYRNLLDKPVAGQMPAMISATFYALEAEFDGSRGSPIGLCVLLASLEERRRRPEAEWSDPRMIYAGYLRDGRQVRIGYFEGAEITRDDTYL